MDNIDPDYIYEKLTILGEEWSRLNAIAEALEENKKIVLSQLGHESGESSATAKETFALRHPTYKEHIKEMVEARKSANIAKVRYDSYKIYVDLLRTKAASERIALKHAT